MSKARVLFVDDEPSIRVSVPAILEMHGFEVAVTATVQDALTLIQQQKFDVLLSDLNIGEPGDGFVVVSAMRRIQPDTVNLIITGYPAFETALEAIRNQVDDYIVKPTNPGKLVALINEKLSHRIPHRPPPHMRVCDILDQNQDDIQLEWLQYVNQDPELRAVPLSEAERTDHVQGMLAAMIAHLRAQDTGAEQKALEASEQHGRSRCRQGYTVPLLLQEATYLRQIVLACVESHLIAVNLSYLLEDLAAASDSLDRQLRASCEAFLHESSLSGATKR